MAASEAKQADSNTCSGAINGSRWCDNGDGTIRDMTSKLVWLKDASCLGKLAWEAAGERSRTLATGQCGLTDGSRPGSWRLPSKEELEGLTTGTEPVLSKTPRLFSGVQTSYYWSSSTCVGYPALAWSVHLVSGYVNGNGKTGSYYVWPVRGGQ